MQRGEDDVETTQVARATCSAARATVYALAGLLAAMLVLGVALTHF